MPTKTTPAHRAELSHRAMVIGHEIRASIPWWNVIERHRIGALLNTMAPTVTN